MLKYHNNRFNLNYLFCLFTQIYLPCLVGLVPDRILLALRYLLDFCYYVRRPFLTDRTIFKIETALERYMRFRDIFLEAGVRKDFKLPRQHALFHYPHFIRQFGAPNGICSSISESKHIEAVKKPWRRSNRYNAMQQMICINTRLDKLRAQRIEFERRGYFISGTADDDSGDEALNEDDADDNDDYTGAINDPVHLDGEVKLALRHGKFNFISCILLTQLSRRTSISPRAFCTRSPSRG